MFSEKGLKYHIKGIVQGKLTWVESDVNRWLVLQHWGVGQVFYFKGHHLGFCRNVLPPLEPKLLVFLEKIGEELQIVCEVLYTVQCQQYCASEYAAHNGMALEPFSTNWYNNIKQGKYSEMLYTTYRAPLLLALIPCFCKLVSTKHQLFLTLPIIWPQVAASWWLSAHCFQSVCGIFPMIVEIVWSLMSKFKCPMVLALLTPDFDYWLQCLQQKFLRPLLEGVERVPYLAEVFYCCRIFS